MNFSGKKRVLYGLWNGILITRVDFIFAFSVPLSTVLWASNQMQTAERIA